MSIKRFFTIFALQFGFILLILGIFLTILGFFGVLYYDNSPEFLRRIIDSIGDWKYWCILLGPIVLIAGAWYFFDNVKMRREFKELMETTSKAKFIRNLDRIEYLAWKLTPEHQNQLAKRKSAFHIK